jgi:hypothetical protein
VLPHEFRRAGKIAAFPDDDLLDSKLHGRSRAEVTRHQGRIERTAAVIAQAAGVAQAIGFRVGHGVIVLDAPIVAASNQFTVPDQARADGNPTLAQALEGFVDRGLHEWIDGRHGGMDKHPTLNAQRPISKSRLRLWALEVARFSRIDRMCLTTFTTTASAVRRVVAGLGR